MFASRAQEMPLDRQPPDSQDAAFERLRFAFWPSGGLATAEALASAGGTHHSCDRIPEWLQREIDYNSVVCFRYQGAWWLPGFQFDPAGMAVRDGPRRIAAELCPWMDGWDCAEWLIQPNAALDHRVPLALALSQPDRVVEAARLEHFLCCG
ncbi:hypothetical protein M4Q70_20210 [Acidovorax valerianellae]|nr:hypothetical protein [Paracidovorax valerianellae]